MMKSIGLASVLFLSSTALFAQEGYRLNCWDGTFAYNTVNVEQVSDGFEVSLSGAMLKIVSEDDAFNWSPRDIHVKFPADSCEVVGQNLNCSVNSQRQGWSNAYFLEHRGPDNGYKIVAAKSIRFSSEGSIELNIIKNGQAPGSDRYGFVAWECNNDGRRRSGGTNWGGAEFNDELRDLIRAQIPFTP